MFKHIRVILWFVILILTVQNVQGEDRDTVLVNVSLVNGQIKDTRIGHTFDTCYFDGVQNCIYNADFYIENLSKYSFKPYHVYNYYTQSYDVFSFTIDNTIHTIDDWNVIGLTPKYNSDSGHIDDTIPSTTGSNYLPITLTGNSYSYVGSDSSGTQSETAETTYTFLINCNDPNTKIKSAIPG